MELPQAWQERVSLLVYAYQPIVNIHTGRTFGVEALIRRWEEAGFDSINALFQAAYEEKVLYALDRALRHKALEGFARLRKKWAELNPSETQGGLKLFFNLDNRILEMPDYVSGGTETLLEERDLVPQDMVFEISEKHELTSYVGTNQVLEAYKKRGYGIAVDDFGSGYSGLQLLYHSEPHVVKIDRFFIDGIDKDAKKHFFIASVVKMANLMGITVIAEGIETEAEYFVCREIGCDYLQGYLIARPKILLEELKPRYGTIKKMARRDRRRHISDMALLQEWTLKEPLSLDSPTEEVLETLRRGEQNRYYPVTNPRGEALGLLDEGILKKYLYSPYGISILQHKIQSEGLNPFLLSVPRVEITTSVERILELHTLHKENRGIIITQDGRYRGFLPAGILLHLLSKKQLSLALDQNPLSQLPGNASIHRFLGKILSEGAGPRALIYFDFNHFKPFNDRYGFRQGDRAIMLFADLLREALIPRKDFIGHVGGMISSAPPRWTGMDGTAS